MVFDKKALLKSKLFTDLYFFTRYFYNKQTNANFIRGEHFKTISDVLEKVYTHEITRLIINIPPRFGKTEIAVINFIAKGLMINPASKFIHTSYSDSLALENSNKIRDLVKSEAFQDVCPIKIKSDTDSKAKWYTEQGGGLYATSSGGAITGFGAGIVGYDGFGGAIIIDDPLKPLDANSQQVRTAVNDRFDNTIISRCNNPNTPIIVIAQRLHEKDLSGVLLERGGWHHVNLPAINEDGSYLWDYKAETIEDVKNNSKYIFLTQYQQKPTLKDVEDKFFYMLSSIEMNFDEYTPSNQHELLLSFDFNHSPTTCVVAQKRPDLKKVFVFDIIIADINTSKNRTPIQAVCDKIKSKYGNITSYLYRITGDGSGTQQKSDRIANANFYTDIMKELSLSQSHMTIKANIKHSLSGDMCNSIFQIFGKSYVICGNTQILQNEIKQAYADKDGSLNGFKKDNGGHFTDAFRYLNTNLIINTNGIDYKRDTKHAMHQLTGIFTA